MSDPDVERVVGGGGPDSLTIAGTGELGASVEVSIGDATETATIGDDGSWSVDFASDDLPEDGVYDSEALVANPDGSTVTLVGPEIDNDINTPEISVGGGTVSTGHIVNAGERDSGHEISRTGEPGASVSVEIDGTTQSTSVGEDGSWSVIVVSDEITTDEYETGITITTTDARGNSTTVSDTLFVDTIAPEVDLGMTADDDIINVEEAAAGGTLNGTGEPGAMLDVTFQGFTATYAAGNSAPTSGTLQIDIETSVSVDVDGDMFTTGVNAAQFQAGIVLEGTTEAFATVVSTTETALSSEQTFAVLTPSVSDGTHLVISSIDAVDN